MRVLHVLDKIGRNSGVSSVVMNYVRNLNTETFSVDFLVFELTDSDLLKELLARGCKVYNMPPLTAGNILTSTRKAVFDFFGKHPDYDIVHGHIANAAFLYFEAAKKVGITRRILHSHNSRGADGIGKRIRNKALNLRGIRLATEYMACSEIAGTYLFGRNAIAKNRVFLLHNAIDTEAFSYQKQMRRQIRQKLGIEGQLVLGHVGRFCEQKNHSFLIDIFKEICKYQPDSRLLLLGGGILESAIKKQIKGYGLEKNVIFIGVTDQVAAYLQAMDVFVLPSLYEGLPVVCVEAQAAGLPCVVADTVSQETKLTERLTYLSLNHDPDIWAKHIIRQARLWKGDTRILGRTEVAEAGYDICRQGIALEQYYLSGPTGR